MRLIDADALRRALSLRDLTDPATGPHAMQLLLDELVGALTRAWGCARLVHREEMVAEVVDAERIPHAAVRGDRRIEKGGAILRDVHARVAVPLLDRHEQIDEASRKYLPAGFGVRRLLLAHGCCEHGPLRRIEARDIARVIVDADEIDRLRD